MAQSLRSPVDLVLKPIERLQSNVRVRAAEAAFLVVFLGGFYLLAFVRLLAPEARGPTYALLTSPSTAVGIALTVVGPFGVVVLEWLAALSRVRDQPGYDDWTLRQRVHVWMELTTVVQNSVTLLYIPILPAAMLWTVVAVVQGQPYWPVPAAIAVADLAVLVAANRFVNRRSAGRLPSGTALDAVGRGDGWM